ncbi:hypothetical protein C8J56DRAFT_330180 [Mycena floridula]|nr:hypothetical protein C8J56DRAFT_330180 [Mycena floridula]
MPSFSDLNDDMIFSLIAYIPLDALSLTMVSKRFFALGKTSSFWLVALKAARMIEAPLACTMHRDLNELGDRDLEALKKIARRTCNRSRKWASSSPRLELAKPTTSIQLDHDFTILFIVPGTPLVILRFFQGPFQVKDRIHCYNSTSGNLVWVAPSHASENVNMGRQVLVATLLENDRCLFAIRTISPSALEHLDILSMEYRADYDHKFEIPVLYSLRLPSQRDPLPPSSHFGIGFGLSSRFCIYTAESAENHCVDLVALDLVSGAVEPFHTSIPFDLVHVYIQFVDDHFYIFATSSSPAHGVLQYLFRCPVQLLSMGGPLSISDLDRLDPPNWPTDTIELSPMSRNALFSARGHGTLSLWRIPNPTENTPIQHVESVDFLPYQKFFIAPSLSMQSVALTTWDMARQPSLTLIHFNSFFDSSPDVRPKPCHQLALPEELDFAEIGSFALEECNGILLVRERTNRLWNLSYA